MFKYEYCTLGSLFLFVLLLLLLLLLVSADVEQVCVVLLSRYTIPVFSEEIATSLLMTDVYE